MWVLMCHGDALVVWRVTTVGVLQNNSGYGYGYGIILHTAKNHGYSIVMLRMLAIMWVVVCKSMETDCSFYHVGPFCCTNKVQ